MEFFTISLLNGISYGLLLFMLSSGLTLIFSMMGVLNFAHASFYMLGAYFAYTTTQLVGYWPALFVIARARSTPCASTSVRNAPLMGLRLTLSVSTPRTTCADTRPVATASNVNTSVATADLFMTLTPAPSP